MYCNFLHTDIDVSEVNYYQVIYGPGWLIGYVQPFVFSAN